MRTLGLLGGMSWESTAIYYRLLNEGVRARLGGLHSAPLVLWSCDFAPIAEAQASGDWDRLARELGEAGRRLVAGGAEALLICTNTMHKLHEEIEWAAGVPALHIADAAGIALAAAGCKRPLLLATRFTMEGAFYRTRLRTRFGIEAIVPAEAERALVHRVIYEELCQGIVLATSKTACVRVVERAAAAGSDGVILGCTEITMLIAPEDVTLPVFDTTMLHAASGVDFITDGLARRA